MVIDCANVFAFQQAADSTSVVTPTFTPIAGRLYKVIVTSKTEISTNPNIPTITGTGLTWVQIDTGIFDDDSSSRRRVTTFRALGNSPSRGALTVDFAGQSQVTTDVVCDELIRIDTGGANGANAIVQSNKTLVTDTGTPSATPGTTLSAFGDAVNNAVHAAIGIGNTDRVLTPILGLQKIGVIKDNTENNLQITTAFCRGQNLTPTFRNDLSEAEYAVVADEIKAAPDIPTVKSVTSNSSTTGTALSVTAPTGAVAGDLMLVFVHVNQQTTIVDNNGATPFTADVSNYKPNPTHGHTFSMFSRIIQPGDPTTYNFTSGASDRWSVIALCIQTPNPGMIYDVQASMGNNSDGDTNIAVAPSINTLSGNALAISMGGLDSGLATVSATPAGWTSQANTANQPMGVATKPMVTPAATGTASFTFGGDTGSYISMQVAVRCLLGTRLGMGEAGN